MSRDSQSHDQCNEQQPGSITRRQVLRGLGAAGAVGLVGASATGSASAASSPGSFDNPVYEPVLADPTIIRAPDGAYYAYGTEDDSPDFDNCDGTEWVPILRSTDLVNWTWIGNAFDTKPSWKSDGNLWAPDINYYDGTYYLYYAYSEWNDSDPGIGVATSDTPDGPFDDQGKLFLSSEVGVENSIDPEFVVDDGTPYLIWGSFHDIYGVELTSDGLDWKSGTEFYLAGDAYEAPRVAKRNGYYYLYLSTGSCCDGHSSTYEVEVGRATDLKGPYYNQNGTDLRNIDSKNSGVAILSESSRFAGPGHNDIIRDDSGKDLMVYHAYDTNDSEFVCSDYPRRSLLIDPVIWNDDWPEIAYRTPNLSNDNVISYGTFDGNASATFDLASWKDPTYIHAAGEDTWDYADEYGSVFDADNVDDKATVTTKVVSQENTDQWAKAGIMIRNDITANGSSTGYVKAQMTPENGVGFDWDSDDDGYCDSGTGASNSTYPVWLRIVKDGTTFTGLYSTDGINWTEIDTTTVSSANATQDAGLFNCGHSTSKSTVEYEFLDVTNHATYDADAGATFDLTGPTYTIDAAGEDTWDYADEYGTIHNPHQIGWSGSAVVRIDSQERTHEWAKAGIVIRNDVTANGSSAGYVNVNVSPDHGFGFDWDSDGDGYLDSGTRAGSTTYPCWLKIERDGPDYTGYYSTDGSNWTKIDSCNLEPNDDLYQDVGMFNCGHSTSKSTVEYGDWQANTR